MQNLSFGRVLFTLAIVAPIVCFGGVVSAQAGSLFRDAASSETRGYTKPAKVKRFRYVDINSTALPSRVRQGSARPELDLPLFFDASFTGVVDDVQGDADDRTWIGTLKGVAGSSFTIVRVGDVYMAHIASTNGVYEVKWVADGVYRIVELDHSKFRDHPEGSFLPFGPKPGPDGRAIESATADPSSPLDIFVAFTKAAKDAAGGLKQIKALIKLAVSETNTSYRKSAVQTRLRLLHVEEYVYAESGDLETDLNKFRKKNAPFGNIGDLRNLYGADMLGLIVEDGGSYCGLAAGIYPGAAKAYQTTARDCATGYYSFGHEFGHLQGARHDRFVDGNDTPYAYGHGYTDWRAPSPWRTVMAYNNKCSSKGKNCVRKDHWSNPNKTYNNRATGTSNTKNYRVLNNTDNTVANYRKRKIHEDVRSSFNNRRGKRGWRAKSGSWKICKSAYYCSKGLAGTGAWAAHKGTFGDVTYTVRMKRTGDCETCANRIFIRGSAAALAHTNWPRPTYAFQYSNTGSCSVYEVTEGGSFIALLSWRSCSALKQNWNTLKVVAVGKEIKFIINGTLVWTGSDDTLRVGEVGIGFYRDGEDPGKLSADWAKIKTTPTANVTADQRATEIATQSEPTEGGSFNMAPR